MYQNLKQINKISFDGNENIVIQDITNSTITINKNNPEELESFFSTFYDRINEFESVLIKNQDEYAGLNNKLNDFFKAKRSICVVGSGWYNLPEIDYKYSKIIGNLIANMNYNLLVGGWEGVDYVVADEYGKVMDKKNVRLSDKLTQIVPELKQPVFKGGNVEYVKEGIMEWIECLKRANALIMIGGVGGTYEAFEYAKKEKIPVIPLPFTGGDAKRAYYDILKNIESFPFIQNNLMFFRKLELESISISEDIKNLLIRVFDFTK